MERNIKDIISTLKENETLNSFEYARSTEQDHQVIVGQLKSLQGLEHVVLEQKSQQEWTLTSEGKECVLNGTPEYRIFKDVEPEGTLKTELEKKYGKPFQFGFQHCMKRKWLEFNKATGKIQKIVNEVKDLDGELLKQIAAGTELSVADYEGLKKRNLVDKTIVNYFIATKGPKFGEEIKEEFADLTSDMLKNKLYETLQFKPFNINSLGKDIESGSLHPLMKTRTTFREILLELG